MFEGIGAAILQYIIHNLIWMVLAAVVSIYVAKAGNWIKSHAWAQKILLIADDITHQALATDPNSNLAKFLASTVDKLVAAASVSEEIATRALTSAYVRAQADGTVEVLKSLPVAQLKITPIV